jgi:replicative DNA helicase
MDFGKESHDLYKYLHDKNYSGDFRIKMGWPGLDSITNGLGEGDICSIVGATGSGKTFHALYVAHDIYFNQKKDVIFISMEMGKDILTQRLSAMITKSNLTEIEHGRETTHIQKNVKAALMGLQELPQKLYIVDGALSSTVEQVEALLQIYKPHALVIDGAYLMQHKNVKLDRYSRVGENIKALKALASKFKIPMVLSYQFNRKAAEKKKKGESAGLEDIGSSADIEQISSIVLALKQAESTETLKQRVISILKGRNGGDNATINIHWDFEHLNFSEIITATSDPSDASTDSHKYDTVDEFND